MPGAPEAQGSVKSDRLCGSTRPQFPWRDCRTGHQSVKAQSRDSEELYANKFRMVISIPVNFETLANSSHRWDWVRAARSIPDDLRPLVAFTLFDLPIGVPSGRLAELLGIVRPFCRTVMITTKLEHTNLSVFSGTKVSIVIASAPRNAPDSKAIAAIGPLHGGGATGRPAILHRRHHESDFGPRGAERRRRVHRQEVKLDLPREVPEHMRNASSSRQDDHPLTTKSRDIEQEARHHDQFADKFPCLPFQTNLGSTGLGSKSFRKLKCWRSGSC